MAPFLKMASLLPDGLLGAYCLFFVATMIFFNFKMDKHLLTRSSASQSDRASRYVSGNLVNCGKSVQNVEFKGLRHAHVLERRSRLSELPLAGYYYSLLVMCSNNVSILHRFRVCDCLHMRLWKSFGFARNDPVRILSISSCQKTRVTGLLCGVVCEILVFSHFRTIPACDWQADGQIQGHNI